MKLELRENMYVRTKDGIIDKILKLNESYVKGVSQKDELYAYDIDNIVKASYNIIDILEVGDAIEIDVIDKDNYPTIMVINFARIDNKVELASIKDMLKNESAKLLTVITHEQMEQMAYKVGE